MHWVGAEAGAIIGMHFALQHPDRVRSLSLTGAPSDFWFQGGFALPRHLISDTVHRLDFRKWLQETNVECMQSITDPQMIAWYLAEEERMSA